MSYKRLGLVAFSIIAVALIAIGIILIKGKAPAPVIAVLDTGISPEKFPPNNMRIVPNLGETPGNLADDDSNGYKDDAIGWNFFEGSPDLTDADGHGTRVTEAVLMTCGDCKVLPIKITQHGAGIRPEDIAGAIRYAIQRGASVINLSAGISQSTPEMEQAVSLAESEGRILVTAAGRGLGNPFRAEPLEKVFPQAYASTIVVGAVSALDGADPLLNPGLEMDLVVTQKAMPHESKLTSSIAAGFVSGLIGEYLRSHKDADLKAARQVLRESTVAPKVPSFAQFGYGGLEDPHSFLKRSPSNTPGTRVYTGADGKQVVDINAREDVTQVSGSWKCEGTEVATSIPATLNTLRKGRARLSLELPAGARCKGQLTLELANGAKEQATF